MTSTDLPPSDESLAVKTLDVPSLTPPETRVGKVWAIRERISEFRRLDRTRADRRNKIQRWFDGARPYSQAKLVSSGQGERTNFNPREADSMADAAKTPYYGLVFRNPQFASISCRYGTNKQRQAQWSASVSRSFHTMLEDWDEFDYNMQLKQWQMVIFGTGLPMFPDSENWQWQSRKMHEFLVPDDIPSSIKKLPEAVYFRKISPVDLFKLIDKEGAAKTMGWFPDRVKRAIVKVAPQAMGETTFGAQYGDDWNENYTASLRRGDVQWNAKTAQIKLSGHLIKEFDGRITHSILIDDPQPTSTADEDVDLLLFQKIGQYECFEQVAQPFFHDIGTGEWHSVRALGPKIRDLTMANARLFCTMIDGAGKSAVFLLQAKDSSSEEISQLIEINGANVIPSGLELQQNRIGESLEGAMSVRHEIQSTLQTTSAQYVPRVSGENSEPTLGQAQLNFQNQQQLSSADADRYLKTLDRLYREMLRRALIMGVKCYKRHHPDEPPADDEPVPTFADDAEEGAYWFVRRAIEDQTPIEALDFKWIGTVKATRGTGGGSPAATDISTKELISMSPTMDPRGKRNAFRARASFLMGQSNVDEFYPPFDEADLPNDHAALATLENNALRTPDGEVLITPLQDHQIHFDYHYGDSVKDLQELQQGPQQQQQPMPGQEPRTPVQVLTHLHNSGPHMKAHLKEMEGDPTMEAHFKVREQAWNDLSKMVDQLQQQVVESLQAQQQPQPQMDPALIASIIKAKGDLAIKDYTAKGKLAIQAQSQQAKNRLKDLDAAFQMNLQKRQAAMEASQPELKAVA